MASEYPEPSTTPGGPNSQPAVDPGPHCHCIPLACHPCHRHGPHMPVHAAHWHQDATQPMQSMPTHLHWNSALRHGLGLHAYRPPNGLDLCQTLTCRKDCGLCASTGNTAKLVRSCKACKACRRTKHHSPLPYDQLPDLYGATMASSRQHASGARHTASLGHLGLLHTQPRHTLVLRLYVVVRDTIR